MPLTDTNPSINAKNYWAAAAKWPWWLQWLICTGVTLILYIPILGNTFVSDDWLVLKRLAMDGRLNTNGFFRPLSDITIWLNYQLGGLNALNYYLFGIVLRGLSVVLLYRFCLRWPWAEGDDRKYIFAGVAALLFITYPFHNEPVAWILGRGALMAGIMAIAALLIATGRYKQVWKIAGVCGCYFIGLLAYESIVVLPVLVLLYLFATGKSRLAALCFLFLLLTLGLHMLLRIEVSGVLTGDYGKRFFHIDGWTFFFNMLKVMVRSVVPPQTDPNLLMALAVSLLFFGFVSIWQLQKVLGTDNRTRVLWFCIVACWLSSLVVPGLGAVSTHTSESDRFLELPSYFLCMLVAYCMIFLLRRKRSLVVILVIFIAFNILHLEDNNYNWAKASDIVKETLQVAKSNDDDGKLFLYQVPGQVNGAFVFRVGLEEAFLLNGIDTARVQRIDTEPSYRLPADRVYYWNGRHYSELK